MRRTPVFTSCSRCSRSGAAESWASAWARHAPKFFYLPEQYTDFIFSVLGEELGLIGALSVIVLFIVLAYRGVPASPSRRPTGSGSS